MITDIDRVKAVGLPTLAGLQPAMYAAWPTKAKCAAAIRAAKLGPELRPEWATIVLGFRVWVAAAEPVGDRGEGRVVWAEGGGWTTVCPGRCQADWDRTRCVGHPIDDPAAFTLALIGHRCEVLHMGTVVEVSGVNLYTGERYRDWNPAGTLHWARCVGCGWTSAKQEESRWAYQAGVRHERTRP